VPLKDFECRSCHHKFEELLMLNEPNPTKCPKCGGSDLKQLLGTFRIVGLRKKNAKDEEGPGDAAGPMMAGGLDGGMDEEYDPSMDAGFDDTGGGFDESPGLDTDNTADGEPPASEEDG